METLNFKKNNRLSLVNFLFLAIIGVIFPSNLYAEKLVFFSDLEGNGGKWNAFIQLNGCVQGQSPAIDLKLNGIQNVQKLKQSRSLFLNKDCKFFYLGDVVDKGIASIRILRDLVYLKETFPGNVFLIAGNREINKLRFLQEITPNGKINKNTFYRFTQTKVQAQDGISTQQLNELYFKNSLGSPDAMDNRSTELGLNQLKGKDYENWSKIILRSLREDVTLNKNSPMETKNIGGIIAPFRNGPSSGLLLRFLELSQIVVKYNDLLLSHGFIGSENFGHTPKLSQGGQRSQYGVDSNFQKITTPQQLNAWIFALNNNFLKTQITQLIGKKFMIGDSNSKKLLPQSDESADKELAEIEDVSSIKMENDNERYKGEELILYQEPTLVKRPGRVTDFNQESVVLGRNSNPTDFGNPFDLSTGPEGEISSILAKLGIMVRISGHTPVGQSPLIQKIVFKNQPNTPPVWYINIDNSAEHLKMENVTSVFNLIDGTFYSKAIVIVNGTRKNIDITFKKDGSDKSRIGERVNCGNKIFTVTGEFTKGSYLIYRVEDKFATNNMESNLSDCTSI